MYVSPLSLHEVVGSPASTQRHEIRARPLGQVAVEFDSCVQHEATCASDRDAVGRYVVGNQAGYVEATRTVDLTDQDPPTFTEVPDDLELECPADPYDVVLSALPAAVDDCSSWVLDST